jgi:hypothetical protein
MRTDPFPDPSSSSSPVFPVFVFSYMIDPSAARHMVPRLKTGPAPLQIAAVRQDLVPIGLPAVPRNHALPALAVAPRSGAGLTTAPAIPSAPNDGVRSSIISDENQKAIFKFLKSSVQPSTNRKYDLQWGWFEEFMRENGSADPFMRDLTQQEKAAMISLFMISRYMKGKRGKAATAATAAVRLRFSQEMLDTSFLDSTVVSTARSACLLNPEDLRERLSSAPASTVKLPVCEEIIMSIRERLIVNRTWSDSDMSLNMLYCGVMYGFEFAARVSEYTEAEKGDTDHCVRTDDLTSAVEGSEGYFSIVGSAISELTPAEAGEAFKNVSECKVRGVTTKGEVTAKSKHISRRSPEESLYLDDLIRFMVHARAKGSEELFSFRKSNGRRVVLTGRSVRDEIKSTCASHGLDEKYFSAHSLKYYHTHEVSGDQRGRQAGQRKLLTKFASHEPDIRSVDRVGTPRVQRSARWTKANRQRCRASSPSQQAVSMRSLDAGTLVNSLGGYRVKGI